MLRTPNDLPAYWREFENFRSISLRATRKTNTVDHTIWLNCPRTQNDFATGLKCFQVFANCVWAGERVSVCVYGTVSLWYLMFDVVNFQPLLMLKTLSSRKRKLFSLCTCELGFFPLSTGHVQPNLCLCSPPYQSDVPEHTRKCLFVCVDCSTVYVCKYVRLCIVNDRLNE